MVHRGLESTRVGWIAWHRTTCYSLATSARAYAHSRGPRILHAEKGVKMSDSYLRPYVSRVMAPHKVMPLDPHGCPTEYAVIVNANDANEALARTAAWHLILECRGILEKQSHHIYCTRRCRCSKKVKRGKAILSHALRQVQFPVYTPTVGIVKFY